MAPDGMDHGGMDHGGMDHGGMAPDGIPLAQGGEDRDGLEMDVLHLSLGPVLGNWPAGLVLRLTLQGDVVSDARASIVDADRVAGAALAADRPGTAGAWRCDNAASVLSLAGWPDAATAARRVRDTFLEGGDDADALRELEKLRRQVRRSPLIRWSLRGIGRLTAEDVERRGLPGHWVGDVYDRLVSMFDADAASQLLPGTRSPGGSRASVAAFRALPGLVTGLDLAAVRLLVSSLALDMTSALEGSHT